MLSCIIVVSTIARHGMLSNTVKYCVMLGLSDGLTNQKQSFKVDMSEAGEGRLGLSIDGSVQTDAIVTENKDACCTVSYTPTKRGCYKVNITLDGQNITGIFLILCRLF